jgi:hypothetical protein
MVNSSEVSRLSKYIEADYDNFSSYSKEDRVGIAFLKTYPKNICMSADKYRRYPYYLMVSCKELMKVHGSSISTRLFSKPEWICCQNIVVSSVTERQMTKVVVPIDEKLISSLKMLDLQRAMKIIKKCTTEVVEFERVPTSLMMFFRKRNRIETFKDIFKNNKIYLETEEDVEKVFYFYLSENRGSAEEKEKIEEVHNTIVNYSKDMIRKKHALVKISERTKLQLNENSQIVDILGSSEYLGILIKSSSKDIVQLIKTLLDKENLTTKSTLEVNTEADITLLYLQSKSTAAAIYSLLSSTLNTRTLTVDLFPLKGGWEDFGGKFKKWKFTLSWYDGTPSSDIVVRVLSDKAFEDIIKVLQSEGQGGEKEGLKIGGIVYSVLSARTERKDRDRRISGPNEDEEESIQQIADEIYGNKKDEEHLFDNNCTEIKLVGVLGEGKRFKDLIEVEEFFEKRTGLKEGIDFRLCCNDTNEAKTNWNLKSPEEKQMQYALTYYATNKTVVVEVDKQIDELNMQLANLKLQGRGDLSSDNMDAKEESFASEKSKETTRKKDTQGGAQKGNKQNQPNSKEQQLSEMERKEQHILDQIAALRKHRIALIAKYESILKDLKEIKFMQELKMDPNMARLLDIADRIKLESVFPELKDLHVLCFKKDFSITRKACIYQPKLKESKYVETMKLFLQKYNRKHFTELNSRIKLNFKGKYVLRIHRHIFQNFEDHINYIMNTKFKTKMFISETNQKTELSLLGNLDQPRKTAEFYNYITMLLQEEEFFLEGNPNLKDKFNLFALFSQEGDDKIQQLNNNYNSELLIEVNNRFKRITLRGTEDRKRTAIRELTDLYYLV